MNICLVYKEEYPWDVRVEKIAQTLDSNGHAVTIVARNLSADSTFDQQGGVRIQRLPALRGWPLAIRKLLSARFFLNPMWLISIAKAMRGKRDQVVVVRDLPLMGAGWLVARLLGAKVVFDMAECYPEMYRSMRALASGNRLLRLMRSPLLATLYERVACRLADQIFVMIEESRDRLIRQGVPADKVTIVSNTPVTPRAPAPRREHASNRIRICYVGFVTRLRGLDQLLRATKRFIEISGDREGIHVDIVGRGAASTELQGLVSDLELELQVTLHGWLDRKDVSALMDMSNVGALTYRVCGHWNHTIPNKIFDYMLAGIPVLATEVLPIRRILFAADAGLVCPDGDTESMAQRLVELRDPNLRQRLGDNGQRAVHETFNWHVDTARMLGALARVVARDGRVN